MDDEVEVCVLEEPEPAVVELDVEVCKLELPELAVEEPEFDVWALDDPALLEPLVDVEL